MSKIIEIAVRLFSPKGMGSDDTLGGSSTRDDIIGALHLAARENPLGYSYMLAEYAADANAIDRLHRYFVSSLGSDPAATIAMAILLRRPLEGQLHKLIMIHPHYDAERRRAAIVMAKAKRAHKRGEHGEYRRLKSERDRIIDFAYKSCAKSLMTSGRCPVCQGTGARVRVGVACEICNGSGRIVPSLDIVSQLLGPSVCSRIEHAVDSIYHQMSALSSVMKDAISDE